MPCGRPARALGGEPQPAGSTRTSNDRGTQALLVAALAGTRSGSSPRLTSARAGSARPLLVDERAPRAATACGRALLEPGAQRHDRRSPRTAVEPSAGCARRRPRAFAGA